jgi:hypothetical protein
MRSVTSRFVVGLGAWLLGAVTATTGSMIAVNELAHGLLGPQSQQLGETTVSADLDGPARGVSPSPTVGAVGTASASTPAAKVKHSPRPSPSTAVGGTAAQSPAGTFLESNDGSATATCQSAGAYLLYWSPNQGFQADDVHRGPAAIASVTFRGPADSVVMRVSCSTGTPVAHVYPASSDGGDGGGE